MRVRKRRGSNHASGAVAPRMIGSATTAFPQTPVLLPLLPLLQHDKVCMDSIATLRVKLILFLFHALSLDDGTVLMTTPSKFATFNTVTSFIIKLCTMLFPANKHFYLTRNVPVSSLLSATPKTSQTTHLKRHTSNPSFNKNWIL